MSNNIGNKIENIVHGEGTWAPGTTTRPIEGHFHKENEPQGVAPISSTGGVPNVDYSTKDKIENAVTGHHGEHSHSGSHGTGSGLTGSTGSSGLTGSNTTGSSGLTGSSHTGNSGLTGSSHTGNSGLTGSSSSHNSGATSGISQKAEEQLEKRTDNTSGSNSTGGGLAQKAQNLREHGSTADGNAGTLSDRTGTADHPAQAHSSTGAGGHHGSTDSPTGTHGSTTTGAHKEGVLEKIKHAIGK